MDSATKETLTKIFEEWGFSEEEKLLIEYSNTATTKEINHSQVISTFLLVKQLKNSTEKIIESNSKLAEAENKNSKKMQQLTWALIGVGTLQAIGVILQLFKGCL
ncbi:hypothetical protein ELY21_11475 [Legionella sp. km535]|uniref:hypothetical protein n=1 Tax=Legionella sp. km535 TaxID=2498107 RepID=UPI000F8C5781|nr:hypothetical protein [Legionella sp. km535]RUR17185.1 hypothetical protein ELY21_11475 [Legionella sp. km535]